MDQYNTDLLDEQLNIIFYKQIYCSATKFVKLKAREEKRARKILVLILKIKLRILLINNKKIKITRKLLFRFTSARYDQVLGN
jgi:hypothetical protein